MALLLACSTMALGQAQKTVTGVVRDDSGAALPGVSINEKGNKSVGTTTDNDGNFSISVKNNAVLVFSFVGFATQEVSVANSSTLSVQLLPSGGELSEVVVTSLGVARQQKSLGYATATVKSEDITRAGSPNFATALYGKAPGVRIGATPGGATSAVNITIRGINSITGKNQPLIVLDGVPIRNEEVNNGNYWGDQRIRGNGLLDINTEDIDNISILKGASAAALYGSDAVNGVVLITTKKGKNKGFTVDVNANYSQDEIAFLPKYQNVRGAGAPINISNGGQDAEGFIYYDVDGDGVKETRGILNYSINFGPKFDGKPTMAWDGVIRPYEAQKDAFKNLFQTAHNSNVNVAVSHVSDNSNVRFSLTRQSNEGISIGSQNTRNIANLNSTFRLGKKFTTDILINYINQKTSNRPYSIDRLSNNFTGMIGRFDNGLWYLNKYKTSMGYRFVTGTGQSLTPDENIIYNGFKGDLADYVWRLKENLADEYSNRVIASMTHNWQIINDLKLRARIATDFTSMRTESRNSTERPLAFGNSGYFGLSSFLNTILYGDVLLTYTKKITPDIDLNVMAGYTATKDQTTEVSRGTNGGLSTENLFDIAASVNTPNSGSRRIMLVKDAYIGTVNFSYKNYAFVEGTIRRDRTSTMFPDNNAFFYPSVNASFVFSDAFQLPSFISYGKVRASWGIVGNYPDIYGANIAYNQNTLGNQGGGQPVLYTTIPGSFGNDGIRPEAKHEFEFGVEAQFFNRRLGLDVSYYNGQIVDQILPLTLPNSSGASSVLTNIGTLRNKGIEIGLKGTAVKNRSLVWDLGVNLAFNQNVVEKLAPGLDQLLHADYDGNAAQLISKVGDPMGDFYAHPVAENDKGEKIVDPNGLYQVDPNRMVKIGNAMPKAVGGISSFLTYKGVSLDIFTDFRIGGYVMPTALNWMISRGLLEESLNYMDKEHGGISYYEDAGGKRIPTNATSGPNGEMVYEDGMIQDGVKADGTPNDYIASSADYYWTVYNWGGPQYSPNTRYELYIKKNSYLKFREISLGYELKSAWVEKLGAKRLQVSVFGRNLFYVYRTLKNMDAEQTTAGSRWSQTLTNVGTNPSTRSFGVMIRASF
ncbi:MAG TPA: SusC/RagA family TonB-linked outer membrane protein [Agriterribacter sp.]|nr:SusC/RagA family TonB-linked outer membrane protein [Agriterribacter sp.]